MKPQLVLYLKSTDSWSFLWPAEKIKRTSDFLCSGLDLCAGKVKVGEGGEQIYER